MHSPLRVKIQNAINKALQLETTDVLFVGGRRRNRKRKRKHGKDKKKSKKYEGKETPILKPKTYTGNNGRPYIALVAEDGISLSPSMIDDLLDGASIDAISVNQDDYDQENDETAYFDDNEDSNETENNVTNEDSLKEEIEYISNSKLASNEDRPSSCDTGYNSEEEHKVSTASGVQRHESNTSEHEAEVEDDVFMVNEEEIIADDDDYELIGDAELEKEIVFNERYLSEVSLGSEVLEDIEQINTELGQIVTEKNEEHPQIVNKEETIKAEIAGPPEKFSGEDLCTQQPRLTVNFDYEEEEEEEIYTKQPKSWFNRKTEEDEELKPLICCGEDNGVGFACCTIL